MSKILKLVILIVVILVVLSIDYSGNSRKQEDEFTYGVSFSKFHTDELGLDWRKTFLAILNDLNVKNFRFSAHWPLTEPEKDKFNFSELDFQMNEARKASASVILAVGRRLPGWPECHEPAWLDEQITDRESLDEKKDYKEKEILDYIQAVINRYKNYPNLKYWQVENEPYLTFFSSETCGKLDREFLLKEIDLVRSLDPGRQILMTDSGELSLWAPAYRDGDVFGTSMYIYIWNHKFGPIRYPITHHFFRIKHNLIKLFFGNKPSIVIELSTEPWLLQPITKTPIEIQLQRMGLEKMEEMISMSAKSGFDTFYLWGAEWWYWLNQNGHPQHWQRAKELFNR